MSFYKSKELWTFIGGIALTTVVPAVLKSKQVHNAAVSAVAKSMEVKDDAQARVTSIKEDAQDIYAEAIEKRK